MGRSTKRRKNTISPAEMGDMRGSASIKQIMFEELSRPLKDIGPGTPENAEVWQIDVEQGDIGDFVSAVFSILSIDLSFPSPATIIKLEGLAEVAGECSKNAPRASVLKAQYTQAKRKIKSVHKYMSDIYFFQSGIDDARIYILNFMIDFGDNLGYDLGDAIKDSVVYT